MYHCQFSTDDQHEIGRLRYHHPDPIVRKRMTILWHKNKGLPHQTIAELSGASPNTVTATIRTYLDKKLIGIQERPVYRPPSQLNPYRLRLTIHFTEHPPRTLKEAAAEIERITGLSFTITHVRNVLLSLGLSRKKQEALQGNWMTPSEMRKNHLFAIS